MSGLWVAGRRSKRRTSSFGLSIVMAATALSQVGMAGAQKQRVSYVVPAAKPAAAAAANSNQGYLGVNIRDASKEQLATAKADHGAEVLHVDHDGPAGKAGLREHDVILTMNGQAIEGEEQLRRLIRETAPGRAVTIVYFRDGQQQTVSTQMANKEELEREAWLQHITVPEPGASGSSGSSGSSAPSAPIAPEEKHGFFSSPGKASRSFIGSIVSPTYTGALLETMAPQLAEYFGAQGKQGLLVRSVDANSPAEQAGLHAGDVVVRVNTMTIVTSNDWLRAVRDNKGKTISVVVLRDRREQTLLMVPNSKHHSNLLPDLWPFGSSTPKANTTQAACVLPIPFSM
jgi:serine protease Do